MGVWPARKTRKLQRLKAECVSARKGSPTYFGRLAGQKNKKIAKVESGMRFGPERVSDLFWAFGRPEKQENCKGRKRNAFRPGKGLRPILGVWPARKTRKLQRSKAECVSARKGSPTYFGRLAGQKNKKIAEVESGMRFGPERVSDLFWAFGRPEKQENCKG